MARGSIEALELPGPLRGPAPDPGRTGLRASASCSAHNLLRPPNFNLKIFWIRPLEMKLEEKLTT